MENSVSRISKVLLDLSRVADVVLYPTRKGSSAAGGKELEPGQRRLLERIDGFRSLEQVLSMSGDIVGVHASLGKLIALGFVTTDAALINADAAAPAKIDSVEKVERPAKIVPPPAAAKVAAAPVGAKPLVAVKASPAPAAKPLSPAAQAASGEIENAKRLLLLEAKLALGAGAVKLTPRVVACTTIEEVYDLIVKFQQHLAKTGKADPDVFLERLSKGLASVRNQSAVARPAA